DLAPRALPEVGLGVVESEGAYPHHDGVGRGRRDGEELILQDLGVAVSGDVDLAARAGRDGVHFLTIWATSQATAQAVNVALSWTAQKRQPVIGRPSRRRGPRGTDYRPRVRCASRIQRPRLPGGSRPLRRGSYRRIGLRRC